MFTEDPTVANKRARTAIEKAARELAEIAEKHLAKFPEEERDSRVDAFARRTFKTAALGANTKSARTSRTPRNRALARGR